MTAGFISEELANLYKRAEELAGRPVEVSQLINGKFIVLWMAFEQDPPPADITEEGALKGFIEMMGGIDTEKLAPHLTDSELKELLPKDGDPT